MYLVLSGLCVTTTQPVGILVRKVIEEEEKTVKDNSGEEVKIPINYKGPNPNGEEYDNLYLDMNGIVSEQPSANLGLY